MPVRDVDAHRAQLDLHARVADLPPWSVGPGIYAAIVSVISGAPRPPDRYKTLVPGRLGLVHVTVEVHHCPDAG